MEAVTDDDLKTMVACTNRLEQLGFATQFKATTAGLKSLKTEKIYAPDEVKIVNFYRFEGASDPSDSAILYAIEAEGGEKGTLVDAYGPDNDTAISNFIKLVEQIEKKVDKEL